MARLHEFQGKAVLSRHGIRVPRGRAAASPAEAEAVAKELGGSVVVKIQAWTTGRAAMGGVKFADAPAEAAAHARAMLAMKVGQFPVSHVLVEEKMSFAGELFVSLSVDDKARQPIMLMAFGGGSGIEERAASVKVIPCDVVNGPDHAALEAGVASMPVDAAVKHKIIESARKLFAVARGIEARSVEINPLAITTNGDVVAADCRITVDDYAVFRHPELGIEIARELDHPPTPLERIAYTIEQADHRGTFFFAQMNTAPANGSRGLIGFHGAGGGGSMMAMDAITNEGFTIANFCDTSGNPSPAKVYRAARVILAQPGLIGYFGSGSGVANQEQYWSAYGLTKAFWEMDIDIPVVIRLGGNTEDRAVDILQGSAKATSCKAVVEGYKKTDPPAKIAARFASLVAESQKRGDAPWSPRSPRQPAFVGTSAAASFAVKQGTLWIDKAAWKQHAPAIISRSNGLLKDVNGAPGLTVKPEELLGKDSDLIACEVECRRDGIPGVFVALDIPSL